VYLQTCKRHWPWDLPPIPGVIFAATSMQIPFMNACGINLKCDYVIANFTIVSQITSLHKLPFCVKNSRTFSKFHDRGIESFYIDSLNDFRECVCVCVCVWSRHCIFIKARFETKQGYLLVPTTTIGFTLSVMIKWTRHINPLFFKVKPYRYLLTLSDTTSLPTARVLANLTWKVFLGSRQLVRDFS
jgi:hypothetical protein